MDPLEKDEHEKERSKAVVEMARVQRLVEQASGVKATMEHLPANWVQEELVPDWLCFYKYAFDEAVQTLLCHGSSLPPFVSSVRELAGGIVAALRDGMGVDEAEEEGGGGGGAARRRRQSVRATTYTVRGLNRRRYAYYYGPGHL